MPTEDKISYTVPQAVAVSGIGRTTLYSLISAKELPIVKIGSRTLIRRIDLEQLLERKLTMSAAA